MRVDISVRKQPLTDRVIEEPPVSGVGHRKLALVEKPPPTTSLENEPLTHSKPTLSSDLLSHSTLMCGCCTGLVLTNIMVPDD